MYDRICSYNYAPRFFGVDGPSVFRHFLTVGKVLPTHKVPALQAYLQTPGTPAIGGLPYLDALSFPQLSTMASFRNKFRVPLSSRTRNQVQARSPWRGPSTPSANLRCNYVATLCQPVITSTTHNTWLGLIGRNHHPLIFHCSLQ